MLRWDDFNFGPNRFLCPEGKVWHEGGIVVWLEYRGFLFPMGKVRPYAELGIDSSQIVSIPYGQG